MKRKIIKILIFFLIWSFVFETGINSYASESQCLISNTIYVDDDNVDGPWDGTKAHPYQYIKDGIGAADDGDTVFVKNGVYLEEFEIFKEINLFGENSEKTIIKPFFYQSYVIIVYSDNVDIKGFQIQDALNAIQISGNSITVEENIFKNHIDGIYVNDFFYSNKFHHGIYPVCIYYTLLFEIFSFHRLN